MALGIIVVLIVGSMIFNFLKGKNKGNVPTDLLQGTNSIEMMAKTHKVEKGENLWNIAVKYYGDGFKWVDIATENKLSNASVIDEGQELVIPGVESENQITSATYTVVKGDSLWTIAIKAYGDGYKWSEIARTNNLINPNIIHPGNILILPR